MSDYDLRTAIERLADQIDASTHEFMDDYERQGDGISTRISGEAAAMHVAALAQVHSELRTILAAHPAPDEASERPHIVHATVEPVAEDVVWCDECEEWVASGAPERETTAPGEALRANNERVWAEGYDAGFDAGPSPSLPNPYARQTGESDGE